MPSEKHNQIDGVRLSYPVLLLCPSRTSFQVVGPFLTLSSLRDFPPQVHFREFFGPAFSKWNELLKLLQLLFGADSMIYHRPPENTIIVIHYCVMQIAENITM